MSSRGALSKRQCFDAVCGELFVRDTIGAERHHDRTRTGAALGR